MHNVGRRTRQLLTCILTCKGWAGHSQEEDPISLAPGSHSSVPPNLSCTIREHRVRFTKLFTCANTETHAPGYKVQSVDIIQTLQNSAQHQE